MNRARWIALVTLVVASAGSSRAFAAGYDTPILYTARHLGMGGTAIGYVDDPSALFHNPAGLRHTQRFSLLGDVSLLLGNITGSPAADALEIDSETTVAPFFMLAASARATDWLTLGFAIYPVASAGGTYKYEDTGSGLQITDSTTLIFFEASVAAAVEIPDYNLSFGLGYRITYVSLTRERLPTERTPENIDEYFPGGTNFSASGLSFAGFRLGVQWQPIPEFEVGFSYRHKTETDIEGTGPTIDPFNPPPSCAAPCALGTTSERISTTFTLPSRLGVGLRMNLGDFSWAGDLEYTIQSQNKRTDFTTTTGDLDIPVPNVFDWKDGLTGRLGFEYRLLDGSLPLRVGYIWENRVTSRPYVTAFGTPPGTTHVATIGGGYETGGFRIDVAYAYRTSKGRVTESQITEGRSDPEGEGACPFCGFAGDYSLTMHGIYLTGSYAWGAAAEEPETEESWGEEPAAPEPTPEPEPEPAPVETPVEEPVVEEPSPEGTETTPFDGDVAPTGAPHATPSAPLPPSVVDTSEEENPSAP